MIEIKKLAIYVHIPFCKSKCKYCDFASFANKEILVDEYVKKLIEEIEQKAYMCKEHVVSSIYFGGGTPSHIHQKYIEKILQTINTNYIVSNEAEITIEINPGTINKDKLVKYKEIGINRLSFGLQTTQDNLLKYIGRIHTFNEFKENYMLARKIGFSNISVDLMFGLPTQTIEGFSSSIDEVILLNPEHISSYSLKIEENTPFYEMNKKGLLKLPSEDNERQMYYLLKNKLKENGFVHYEISNFAKEGYYSRHNTAYWERQDYLGFGSSAASCFNEVRYENERSIEEYLEQIKPKVEEVLTEDDIYIEKIILGLRLLSGIDSKVVLQNKSIEVCNKFNKVTANLVKKGLIVQNGTNIKLTDMGLDFANMVFVEYMM